MDQDGEHLRLLAIFHYVYGGMVVSGAFIPLIFVFLGAAMMGSFGGVGSAYEMPGMGQMFIAMGVVGFLLCAAIAVCVFLSARFLAQHRNALFSQIIAGIICLSIPFGTALGIFTLVVLARSRAQVLFDEQHLPPASFKFGTDTTR